MNVLEQLKRAREQIAAPNSWIQGKMAKDKDGREWSINDKTRLPTCFCAAGAVKYDCSGNRVLHKEATVVCLELLLTLDKNKAIQYHSNESVIFQLTRWNDAPERTHAQVLALYDATIARLEFTS